MEPVTHMLTGACLSRAGFNRRAAYATLTMALAAEMPDIDTVWSWRGPVEGFAHHRGITHTFLALPVEAAILVAAIYGLHRWRRARASRTRIGPSYTSKPLTQAPVRWWTLYGCALVGLLSHLLLDYTNNYGLRPFYPFNPHWYAASIAFIFDPVIFLLLASALLLPLLFGLVSAEVGAKASPFRGRGLAIAALLCIVAWWGLRAVEHHRAVEIGMQQTYDLEQLPVDVTIPAQPADSSTQSIASGDAASAPTAAPETELVQPPSVLLQARRVLASPDPLDPFHWAVAIDYGPLYQLANVDARTGAIDASEVTYPKPPADAVIRAAEESPLGRVYLDWSSMPIVSEEAPLTGRQGGTTRKVVLRDPRFMGDVSWLRLTKAMPLTAAITVSVDGGIVRETMDGRREPSGRGPIYDARLTLPSFGSAPASESKAAPTQVVAPTPEPVKHTAVLPQIDLPMNDTSKAETAQPVAPIAVPPQPVAAAPKPEITPPAAQPAAPKLEAKVAPPSASAVVPTTQTVTAAPFKAPLPTPNRVPTPSAKAEPPAAEPKSTTPGAFERGYSGVTLRVARFRKWLHWLANGD